MRWNPLVHKDALIIRYERLWQDVRNVNDFSAGNALLTMIIGCCVRVVWKNFRRSQWFIKKS